MRPAKWYGNDVYWHDKTQPIKRWECWLLQAMVWIRGMKGQPTGIFQQEKP